MKESISGRGHLWGKFQYLQWLQDCIRSGLLAVLFLLQDCGRSLEERRSSRSRELWLCYHLLQWYCWVYWTVSCQHAITGSSWNYWKCLLFCVLGHCQLWIRSLFRECCIMTSIYWYYIHAYVLLCILSTYINCDNASVNIVMLHCLRWHNW